MVAKKREKTATKTPLPADWGKALPGWKGKEPAPEITPEALDARNVKEKISIWLDQDLLDAIRTMAASRSEKYQPLINRLLREVVNGEGGAQPPELSAMVRKWLAANPGITRSTLINLAVETFIAAPRTFKALDSMADEVAAEAGP